MVLPLIILLVISSSWLILYSLRRINQTTLNLLIALGAGSMLAISLVHILPEAIEQTELAVYAFMAGFLLIYLIEEILTPHVHDHAHEDHSYEDPHEHYDHVALVAFTAIFVHTIFDGLGIRAGFGISETVGYSILAGVAIHQIPVSLSLAAILRESKLRKNIQIILLAFFAIAAPIGYVLSDLLLAQASPVITWIATAFAGGSLLYVATADLLPIIHVQTRKKYAIVALFVFGVVLMIGTKTLEVHDHDDSHGEISKEEHQRSSEG